MGSKQITVPGSNKFLRDTLDLFSSHINVDIEIHGLPAPGEATRAGIPYKLSIEKSNAQTDFNNEINEDEKGTCYPELVYDSPDRRLPHQRPHPLPHGPQRRVVPVCCTHLLRLEDADGNTLVTGSIYNYLQQHLKSIDVTKQEAYLPISIVFTPVGVTIKILMVCGRRNTRLAIKQGGTIYEKILKKYSLAATFDGNPLPTARLVHHR